MKRIIAVLILVFFLGLAGRVLAQSGSGIREIIVGENDTAGTFRLSSGSCIPASNYLLSQNSIFSWPFSVSTSGYGVAYFNPVDTGFYIGSALYEFGTLLAPDLGCNGSSNTNVNISVRVRNDSVIRFRPKYQEVFLNVDTLQGGWHGSFDMMLDNNLKQTAGFSQWTLKTDTSIKMKWKIMQGTKEITSYQALANERKISLSAVLSSDRGPVFSDSIHLAIFSVLVHSGGKDSVYTSAVDLHFIKAPYRFNSWTNVADLHFTTDVGTSETKEFILLPDKRITHYAYSGTHPFTVSGIRDSANVKIFQITCSPKSGGYYYDPLKIYCDLPDYNGDLRTDSVMVNLFSNTGTKNDAVVWEQFSYPLASAKAIVVIGDTLIAGSKEFYATMDRGSSWVQAFAFDDTVRAPLLLTHYSSLLTSFNNAVYYSVDLDRSWQLNAPGGIQFCAGGGSTYHSAAAFASGDLLCRGNYLCTGRGNPSLYDYSFLEKRMIGTDLWEGLTTDNLPGDMLFEQSLNAHYLLAVDSTDHIIEVCNSSLAVWKSNTRTYRFEENITTLAIDRNGTYYVALPKAGIFISDDTGYTWKRSSLLIRNVQTIYVTPYGEVYVSSPTDGLYHSTDRGANWYGIGAGLDSVRILSIQSAAGQPVFIGTAKNGMFRSKYLTRSVPKGITSKNTLRSSANPAFESTTISFHSDAPAHYELTLYDMLGREIKSLASGFAGTAEEHITTNFSDLPAGNYIIHLQTDRGAEQMMILHL